MSRTLSTLIDEGNRREIVLRLQTIALWMLGSVDRRDLVLRRSLPAPFPCNDLELLCPLRLLHAETRLSFSVPMIRLVICGSYIRLSVGLVPSNVGQPPDPISPRIGRYPMTRCFFTASPRTHATSLSLAQQHSLAPPCTNPGYNPQNIPQQHNGRLF